jgi:glycosyltransferase involved in cell wall biosynthesis
VEAVTMRVLHLRSSLGLYGAEGVILALARETVRAGHQAVVAVLADRRRPDLRLQERAAAAGLDTDAVAVAGRVDPLAVARLTALLRRRRVDLLHAHDYKTTIMGLPAAALAGVPVVANLHGDTAESRAVRLYEWLNYRALRFCGRVVAVSPQLRARAAAFVPAARLLQIDNGVDLDGLRAKVTPGRDLRRELAVPADAPLLGMVGRLAPEKAHAAMIAALAGLTWPGPAPHLLVAGDGPLHDATAAAAREHGVASRVHLLGARSDLPDVYTALTALVHPSLTEGLPLVVLEAAALGVPIVASRVGAIPEVLEDGAGGLLVPPGDVAALGAAVDALLAAPALAHARAARAAARIEARYSARAMTGRYLAEAYAPVVGQRR